LRAAFNNEREVLVSTQRMEARECSGRLNTTPHALSTGDSPWIDWEVEKEREPELHVGMSPPFPCGIREDK
jgi:hypothetical protein